MGKSEGNAIWLNEDMLSHFDFYQFWRNTEDADVGKFLKLFTTLPLEECTRLAALEGSAINEAKKVLAFEATKMIRGQQAAEQASETARKAFEQKSAATADSLPRITLSKAQLAQGMRYEEAFVAVGAVASKGEARRLYAQNGLKYLDANGHPQPVPEVITLAGMAVTSTEGAIITLAKGKKDFYQILAA
jgi:tyrosyl-tRNA synthetase